MGLGPCLPSWCTFQAVQPKEIKTPMLGRSPCVLGLQLIAQKSNMSPKISRHSLFYYYKKPSINLISQADTEPQFRLENEFCSWLVIVLIDISFFFFFFNILILFFLVSKYLPYNVPNVWFYCVQL